MIRLSAFNHHSFNQHLHSFNEIGIVYIFPFHQKAKLLSCCLRINKFMIDEIFFYLSLSFLILHDISPVDENILALCTLLYFWDLFWKMFHIACFWPVKVIYLCQMGGLEDGRLRWKWGTFKSLWKLWPNTRFWLIAITPVDNQHILLNCLNSSFTRRLGHVKLTIAKMTKPNAFYLWENMFMRTHFFLKKWDRYRRVWVHVIRKIYSL